MTIALFFLLSQGGLAAQLADSATASPHRFKKFRVYPVLYFSPETSAGLGISTVRLFHAGQGNRTSNLSGTALYTLNNQILIEAGTTTFFDQEKWLLKRKGNFRRFPEFFYGVGEHPLNAERITTRYTYYNLQAGVYRCLGKGFFVGLQATYNRYVNLSVSDDDWIERANLLGKAGARNVGVGGSVIYDTRDDVLNARKGTYGEVAQLVFSPGWGSDYGYQAYTVDLRHFRSLSDRSVLAMQFLGLVKSGDVPFLQLSYLGGEHPHAGLLCGSVPR